MATDPLKNPVGFLQEFCMKFGTTALPKYIDLGGQGADHCKVFACKIVFEGHEITATACQKKQAKFEAAKRMYFFLEDKKYFAEFDFKVSQTSDHSQNFSREVTSGPDKFKGKNPISILQEFCQSKRSPMPNYFDTRCGDSFHCECTVLENKTFGSSTSKKSAKTEAAGNMCIKLGLLNIDRLKEPTLEQPELGKNAISVLQEFCASKSSLPDPVYQDKGMVENSFIVTCNVGTISGEGRDSTKKGAKLLAANRVLGQLNQQHLVVNGDSTKSNDISQTHSLGSHSLEEFGLSSDEEDNNTEDKKFAVKLEPDIGNTLESLSLDDSVIEVEPRNLATSYHRQDVPKVALIDLKKEIDTENEHQAVLEDLQL